MYAPPFVQQSQTALTSGLTPPDRTGTPARCTNNRRFDNVYTRVLMTPMAAAQHSCGGKVSQNVGLS